MHIKQHVSIILLNFFCYLYRIFNILLACSIAFCINQHKRLRVSFQQIQEHPICLLQPMHDVNQDHYQLLVGFWRVFKIIFNQTSPLHNLLLGSIRSIAVSRSIYKNCFQRKLYLQKCQLFCFPWLFTCLDKLLSNQRVDEGTFSYVASSEEDKLLVFDGMGDKLLDIAPIAHSQDAFGCDLLVGSSADERTVQKGEKFGLSGIYFDQLFGYINHLPLKIFHRRNQDLTLIINQKLYTQFPTEVIHIQKYLFIKAQALLIIYSNLHMEAFDFDKYKQLIQQYGLQLIIKIIDFIRPNLPIFLTNQEILSLAIMLAGLLTPIAVGSAITSAQLLSKVSLFGINAGAKTVSAAVGAVTTTVKLATNLLVVKPLYLMISPFRRSSQDAQIRKILQQHKFQKHELKKYRDLFQRVGQQSDKLFLIIRPVDAFGPAGKDQKVILGSLQVGDKVERILPLLRKNYKDYVQESIQFICNRTMLRLDARLSELPRNEFGAIEIYYVMMQTFG